MNDIEPGSTSNPPRDGGRRPRPRRATLVLPGLGLLAAVALLWNAGRATQAQERSGRAGGTPPMVQNPHGDLKVACEACHTAESWTSIRRPVDFDHATTGFPLAGRHAGVACQDCHASPVFARVATSCADCHRDVHEGRNGLRCQDCHTPEHWTERSDAVRDHARSGFPLRGVHALVECSRCHGAAGEGNLAKLSSECASCHAADYAAARQPDHAAAGFPTQCEQCHRVEQASWAGAGFDHAASGFPLTGAHTAVECARCHAGGRYTGTPSDCYACHQADYAAAQNPDHTGGGFSTGCIACHTTNTWRPASLDHSRTRFPLTGAHAAVECSRCHTGGQYTGTPTDCYACHQADYAGTTNPNHATAGFATTCASCHTTSAWQPATFDHALTRFPLTGAHAAVECSRCHVGGQYTGTPTDCYACHQADYAGTSNPNHLAAGFATTCASCHTTSAWQPATFDHDGLYFRIDSGKHLGKWSSCTDCHQNPSSYRDFNCLQCHEHNQIDMDDKHREVTGYRYESSACYACHRNA